MFWRGNPFHSISLLLCRRECWLPKSRDRGLRGPPRLCSLGGGNFTTTHDVQYIPILQRSKLGLRDVQKLAEVIPFVGGRAGMESKSLWGSYNVCIWGGRVCALKRTPGWEPETHTLILALLLLHYMILGQAFPSFRPQCLLSELNAEDFLVYSFPSKKLIALIDLQRNAWWSPKMF